MEECALSQVPRSSTERQEFIAAQEKIWMSLSWDRKRYTSEQAKTALTLLSAIAFSDHRDPIDVSHLSDDVSSSRGDGSSADGGSSSQRESQRGSARRGGRKRHAEHASLSLSQKPPKKIRSSKPSANSPIPKGTQVACLDKSSGEMWVLGRVTKYMSDTKKYEVLDHDGEEQRYRVTRENLRVIPKRPQSFEIGKPVLAVYPSTTVFYKAKLVSRKGKNWAVEFEDEDDNDSNKIKEVDGRFILQDCL